MKKKKLVEPNISDCGWVVEESVGVLIEVGMTIMVFGGGSKLRMNEPREKALSMSEVFSFRSDIFTQKFKAYSLIYFY